MQSMSPALRDLEQVLLDGQLAHGEGEHDEAATILHEKNRCPFGVSDMLKKIHRVTKGPCLIYTFAARQSGTGSSAPYPNGQSFMVTSDSTYLSVCPELFVIVPFNSLNRWIPSSVH
jgi:hypothetical protein